ncbi:MAG: hypothetical protein J1F42_04330 [Lachnospiraceae bacterium]|nr:hypothetical protein [Lachnospiraceae bacterium]
MAIRMKKVLSILTAVAIVAVSVPHTTVYATENIESEVSDTAEEQQESGEGHPNGENVLEDGEVVMEGALGKVDESQWITMDDYELMAENDLYKLYLYAPRLSILLENKQTGKIIESTLSDEKDDGNSNKTWNGYMKSGIVIQAIIGTTNTYQVDMITCANTVDVTQTQNGFSEKITFSEYGFELTVNVSLDGEDLIVNIPDESIAEKKESNYISAISLFPFMGYSFLDDEEGYMLIPDGNGALINLDNKEGRYTTGFSQMIYGKDAGFTDSGVRNLLWDEIEMVRNANQVIAPIFGMAHTEEGTGYLAVVEAGEKRASIEAHPNGVMVNYNRCFTKFLLRDIYVQPLNNSNSGTTTNVEADRTHTDLQVRYMLLSEGDANYSTMAVRYRNYLLDNELVTRKDAAYNTRVDFLGTDREEFLMGTKAVTVTTTEDIEKIYDELQGAGVDSVLSVYKGWQKGGIYNLPISKYKADSHIGGTSRLTNLIKDSAEENYKLYLYSDALRINPATNAAAFNTIKKVNKRTFVEDIWAQVYDTFYYLTPERSAATLNKFVKSYTKKDVNNLAVAGISNNIFSYSYRGNFYTRYDVAETYENMAASLDEDVNLLLEQPFAYLWNYTDAFLDMPLGSSDYMYVDEEIPFLSMVLKGVIPMYSDYVNFEANKTEFFLQMVESGVYPSFYITYENSSALIYTNSSDLYSTEYATYRDTIISYDAQLREVASAVDGALIMKHEKLDNGVTVVSYDNGVAIYINYSDREQIVDGVTVDAMSYKVGDAK